MERDHLEELGIEERIILNGSFGSWMWRHVMDCSGSEWRQVDGCCECGIEPSDSIKLGEFLDYLFNC